MPVGPHLVQRTSDNAIFLVSGNRVAHIPNSAMVKDLQFRLELGSIRRVDSVFGERVGIEGLVSSLLPPPPVPVQPGLQHEQFLLGIGLQETIANQLAELQRAQQADARRLQEAQLGANPADFVAFELFKRSMEEQGLETSSPARSDVDIQDLFSLALDLEGVDGASIGTGQFGVDLPASSAISRSQLQGFNATDIDLLSSFLRGGVETDEGTFQGVNPGDFFTELEEGLIPVLPGQRTQFRF